MEKEIQERVKELSNTINKLQQEIKVLDNQKQKIDQGIRQAELAIISRRGAIAELNKLLESKSEQIENKEEKKDEEKVEEK